MSSITQTADTTQFGGPVSTEWDDALRRHGIIPPLEDPVLDAEPEDASPAAAAAAKPSPSADGGADDEDADAELDRLRAERLEAIKGESGRSGEFGLVLPLTRDDYTAEVNQAGEGVGVVVFLFKPRHYVSAYTLVLLEKLARRHPHVKFLQIESTECIPGYPDHNLPTLLLYRDDDLLGQCVGPVAFGASARTPTSFGIDDVEWELAQVGLVETALPVNPHANGPRS